MLTGPSRRRLGRARSLWLGSLLAYRREGGDGFFEVRVTGGRGEVEVAEPKPKQAGPPGLRLPQCRRGAPMIDNPWPNEELSEEEARVELIRERRVWIFVVGVSGVVGAISASGVSDAMRQSQMAAQSEFWHSVLWIIGFLFVYGSIMLCGAVYLPALGIWDWIRDELRHPRWKKE